MCRFVIGVELLTLRRDPVNTRRITAGDRSWVLR